MRKTCRSLIPILFLALLTATAGAVLADGETDPAGDVRLTFRVGNTAPDGTESVRTYHLTSRTDAGRARLTQGFRVPIPTTSSPKKEGSEIVPITSISYQNVGFTVDVEVNIFDKDRFRLVASVEDSHLARMTQEGHPVIATASQRLDVTLVNGKSHRITMTEDPEYGSMFLEITAEILD